ncbi:hypothetical protein [Pseudonocardia acaciae]|uniref:hypothetical protein n=1 Tax=Pseudonocardia acaciae TaxID=551276 RepID=UPI0007E8E921|nr:hypothetical protein [Pseudonocardia acaciae]
MTDDRAVSDEQRAPSPSESGSASEEPAVFLERRTALDGSAVADRAQAAADRAHAMLVVFVLLVDAVLLAILEMMFVTASVGGVPLPLSALVALMSSPWLVRRVGELAGPRWAAAPLGLWFLTCGVLAFAGPGGDVLLVGDLSALLLLAAAVLPAAFRIGRMLRPTRPPAPPSSDPPAPPTSSVSPPD